MDTMYTVEICHPAAQALTRKHAFTVTSNPDGTYYAKASAFGCGKNLRSHRAAIRSLASENGCRVLSMLMA